MTSQNESRYYNTNFINIYKIIITSAWISFTTSLRYMLIFIPNIELVTFFLMLSTLIFTTGISFSILNIFCLVQVILFGITDIAYFYIFNTYWLIIFLLKKIILKYNSVFSFLIFIFGLLFGFLYSLEYILLANFRYACYYWFSGIIFDIIHSVGNCIFSIIMFKFFIDFFIIISETKPFLFNSYFNNSLKIKNSYLLK